MNSYFNVFIEFNHSEFYYTIEQAIAGKVKGYVCVVDANILSMAQKSVEFRLIINSSLVNTCDGSSIALMAGWIHKKKFLALNGPEVFETYITKPYRQVLLGSSPEVTDLIKQRLVSDSKGFEHIFPVPLPFCSVDEFDYEDIAKIIEAIKPEIIWVSLGAPKQEIFMYRLLPHLKSGVMFGIGAAFNFYVGLLSIPSFRIGGLRFIWLNRLFQEPLKLSKRVFQILKVFPKMYWIEIYKVKSQSKNAKSK